MVPLERINAPRSIATSEVWALCTYNQYMLIVQPIRSQYTAIRHSLCSQHTFNTQSTCSQYTVNLQSAHGRHAVIVCKATMHTMCTCSPRVCYPCIVLLRLGAARLRTVCLASSTRCRAVNELLLSLAVFQLHSAAPSRTTISAHSIRSEHAVNLW